MRLRLTRREVLLLALVLAAFLVWVWQPFGPDAEGTPTVRSRARPEAPDAPIPRNPSVRGQACHGTIGALSHLV